MRLHTEITEKDNHKERKATNKRDTVRENGIQKQESTYSRDLMSEGDLAVSREVKSGFGLFKKLTFCFPLLDSELTPKRTELIGKTIQTEGGVVVDFRQNKLSQTVDYLLCNPVMRLSHILLKVHRKIDYKGILNYRFIQDSLRAGRLMDTRAYFLDSNDESHSPEPTRAVYDRIRKMTHLNSNSEYVRVCVGNNKKEEVFRLPQQTLEEEEVEREKKESVEEKSERSDEEPKVTLWTNKQICDELMKLQKIYEDERDIGRKIAYLKAVSMIRSLDYDIDEKTDLGQIKGIGRKIADKIKELMQTGKINKLETFQLNEKMVVCGQLCQIWGVGGSKANQLFQAGIRSIRRLRENTTLLTKNQRIGLRYFEDFQIKIPRKKISDMFQFVQNTFKELFGSAETHCLEVCGSYRRGKPECGDIDIIISRKDGIYEKDLLLNLVIALQSKGFLTHHLTFPKVSGERCSTSYMGVCQFESTNHHRIDIKYYPMEQYAFALLYFTGSGMFNRMLRLHATKLGLQLSDHGVVPRLHKGIIWKESVPPCYTEEDIFRLLKLEYKAPQERDL